ncbi:MAG: hypothetical protein S4CHLAM102_00640 [Chlamydiia bacterium]|nr:hypothetical protein [Chlamydiia bacterium]
MSLITQVQNNFSQAIRRGEFNLPQEGLVETPGAYVDYFVTKTQNIVHQTLVNVPNSPAGLAGKAACDGIFAFASCLGAIADIAFHAISFIVCALIQVGVSIRQGIQDGSAPLHILSNVGEDLIQQCKDFAFQVQRPNEPSPLRDAIGVLTG